MYDSSDVWEGGLDGSDEAAIKAAQTTMTPKNIQDVVAEVSEEIHGTFASAYAIGEKVNPDWLTTTLTHLVKEVKAGERERIHTILEDQLGRCDEYEEGCSTCDIWKALNDEQIERT